MKNPSDFDGLQSEYQSGRRDLNSGPPAPKAGALAVLRHAPFL